ncbi:MAG: hypothetical protein ACLTSZ_01760 [Lachnospiraceae bacterium]
MRHRLLLFPSMPHHLIHRHRSVCCSMEFSSQDINFAVDGGMYAELIKSGSFEYGMLAKNSGKHNYSLSDKSAVTLEVVDGSIDGTCLNENNPHCGVITNASDAPERWKQKDI